MWWKELGEKPPAGTMKKVLKPGEITHYKGPGGRGPVGGGAPPAGSPPVSGGSGPRTGPLTPAEQAQVAKDKAANEPIRKRNEQARTEAQRAKEQRADTRAAKKKDREKDDDFDTIRPVKPEEKAQAGAGTHTAQGADFDSKIFSQIKAEHPDWSTGKVAQEAARLVKMIRGQK